jgi:FixJ family two-component response regulator
MIATDSILVAVVDDDTRICRSVSRALSVAGYAVRSFSSPHEYLRHSLTLRHACLLADLRMSEMDGVAMHRASRSDGLDVPTVFMTASSDVSRVIDAMRAGACDVLAKPFSPEALLSSIDLALSRARMRHIHDGELAALWRTAATLTPREAQVVTLVVTGLLNKRVAALLGVSEKTVKVHRGRAMTKLKAGSVAGLVRIVDRLTRYHTTRIVLADGTVIEQPAVVELMRSTARAR